MDQRSKTDFASRITSPGFVFLGSIGRFFDEFPNDFGPALLIGRVSGPAGFTSKAGKIAITL